ncbi:hypothetical protein Scep_003203 [Stephania cephalantha]|uniref:Uncharacterized protein n=1 Tax=Stephania cephalantha TaxID=152367 RepID=A0AAP0KSG4_9MAGN
MQTGKSAAETIKETGSNVMASAKAGMEKTKATVQEKVERMTTSDPLEKELATERKEGRINQAELEKQEARHRHAAERVYVRGGATGGVFGHGHSTETGAVTYPTSALPGHGTGEPIGQVTERVVAGSHPVGINTGTGGTTARNPKVGGTTAEQYGTGGGYS